MALLGHDSFLPTLDEFLAHWALVDAALPAGAPLQSGGALRGDLQVLRDAMQAGMDALGAVEVSGRVASAEIGLQREVLRGWMGEFRGAVEAWWPAEVEGRLAKPLPMETAALDKVLAWGRAALRLWARMDGGAAPPGVVLPLRIGPVVGPPGAAAGLDRAGFAALLDGLVTARNHAEDLDFQEEELRVRRNVLERQVRDILGGYAVMVAARLGKAHELAPTIPRLTPLPGHTPDAVESTALWDAAEKAVRMTWAASEDPKLDHYQVRWSRGRKYDKKKERVAATVPADGPREVLLRDGLEQPGDVASYKVYVVLTTGNERGGQAAAFGV